MLGADPTYGHPKGLVRRPAGTWLTQMSFRAGKMTNVKGTDDLGPSVHLAFRANEKVSAVPMEEEGPCRRT